MNYQKTLDFMFSQLPAYHRIGKAAYKNTLDNTIALDEYFGHPHRNFRTIHVAGTNGKGSVSHMLASVFIEAGYKTGLYTSPHLKDFRERIRVNGRMIPRSEVTGFIEKHSGIIESVKPSFFEMTVAMAFDFFSRQEVDIAVIEVGLGGRLDSTNIIIPELSVITNIGHDHMDLLGDTMEKIASEKAGIMKQSRPVVIGEPTKETRMVFNLKAKEAGCQVFYAEDNFECSLAEPIDISGLRDYILTDIESGKIYAGQIPLGGNYQQKNLKSVIQSLILLKGEFGISDEEIRKGIRNVIENTGLAGRWQTLRKKPYVICDTGHNREGLEYVVKQLMSLGVEKVHFVLGFVSDKDISLVLPLFPKNGIYYFTRASVPRALDEKKLKEAALAYELMGEAYPSVSEALKSAVSAASVRDVVFVGGSTFVVADVI
jgi:dihydrofolate synthase / folylpolyglutamate synthase